MVRNGLHLVGSGDLVMIAPGTRSWSMRLGRMAGRAGTDTPEGQNPENDITPAVSAG